MEVSIGNQSFSQTKSWAEAKAKTNKEEIFTVFFFRSYGATRQLEGVVPAHRYDGARLRSHRGDLPVLLRFLRGQDLGRQDHYHLQAELGTAVCSGQWRQFIIS